MNYFLKTEFSSISVHLSRIYTAKFVSGVSPAPFSRLSPAFCSPPLACPGACTPHSRPNSHLSLGLGSQILHPSSNLRSETALRTASRRFYECHTFTSQSKLTESAIERYLLWRWIQTILARSRLALSTSLLSELESHHSSSGYCRSQSALFKRPAHPWTLPFLNLIISFLRAARGSSLQVTASNFGRTRRVPIRSSAKPLKPSSYMHCSAAN